LLVHTPNVIGYNKQTPSVVHSVCFSEV